MPYLAMAVGIVLVAVVALKTAQNPLNGLIVGTVLLVAVVMVRQLLAQRENVRLLARTTALAATDTLTGLTNRRTFFEEADTLLAHAHASGQSVSALMIDVDAFKHVNDTYGHAAGDLVQVVVMAVIEVSAGVLIQYGEVVGKRFARLDRLLSDPRDTILR